MKAKRVSYKGIPAKNRAQVAKIRKFRSLDISLLDGKPDTPQEIWKGLNKHWEKQRADELAKKESEANARAGNIRRHAIESLRTALRHLMDAHDAAGTIEDETESPFDSITVGKFVRLTIEEAGEKMEQSLCNLGLIPESDGGYFLDALKREGADAEVSHG